MARKKAVVILNKEFYDEDSPEIKARLRIVRRKGKFEVEIFKSNSSEKWIAQDFDSFTESIRQAAKKDAILRRQYDCYDSYVAECLDY